MSQGKTVAKKKNTRRAPTKRVTAQWSSKDVVPIAWSAACELSNNDIRRIQIVNPECVIVHNQPFRKR